MLFAAFSVCGIVPIMRENNSPDPSNENRLFAGRDAIFARMQQRIFDQPYRQAIAFIGQDGVGKSALLRQFTHSFHDPILSLYFPLPALEWTTEENWLRLLRDAINQLLVDHNYSMNRVPDLTAPEEDGEEIPPQWFREEYLPQVLRILRSHRRLVWLFDDAEILWQKLPPEHLTYLHDLLAEQEQLAIVLTLNSRHEEDISKLQPLLNPLHVERLHPLTQPEVETFFRQVAPALSEEQIQQVWQECAGFPTLVQRYAVQMTQHGKSLSAAGNVVYEASVEEFRSHWQQLTQDERFVLTACASLLYDDPTQPITAERIERWLVETDFPLDSITIHAALRGLDYRHLVQQRAEGHLEIVGKLFQRWLMEHARLGESADGAGELNLSWRIIVLVAILVILVLAAVAVLPPIVSAPAAVPTVTLSP